MRIFDKESKNGVSYFFHKMKSLYSNPVSTKSIKPPGIIEWESEPTDRSSSTISKKTPHNTSSIVCFSRLQWKISKKIQWGILGFLIGSILVLIIHFTSPILPPSLPTIPPPSRPVPMWPTTGAAFSYDFDSNDGPMLWGQIMNYTTGIHLFPQCNSLINKKQSPIDLPILPNINNDNNNSNIPLKTLIVNYSSSVYAIRARKRKNPGFQLEPIEDEIGIDDDIPEISNPGGIFEKIGGKFKFIAEFHQAHLHWPSEHTINGSNLALELHLVHETEETNNEMNNTIKDDIYTEHVISILFPKSSNGEHNRRLDSFLLDAVGPVIPELLGSVDFTDLLLDTEVYYYIYSGSLTSPPCTSGVKWYIFISKTGVNELQVATFAAILGGVKNNRPIQLLEGRQVEINAWKRN